VADRRGGGGASLERIGHGALVFARHASGILSLAARAVARAGRLGNPAVRSVLFRQVYFTGIEALGIVLVTGALIGVVIATQVVALVGSDPVLIGKILVWTVVRELGPLFCAVVITARSASAMAAELGTMVVSGEVDAIASLGIDPFDYLVVPRIVGSTLSLATLTLYFVVAAVAGGYLLSAAFVATPIFKEFGAVFAILELPEVALAFSKSLLFGLLLAAASCYHGLTPKRSLTEVPRATSLAVLHSLTLVVACDGLVGLVAFAW
jgi:phospholipid/cholesterol/gamma-HCH transport system permease protein